MSQLLRSGRHGQNAPVAPNHLEDKPQRGVSVVVPMYNEMECVPHLLNQLELLRTRNHNRFQIELLLVDDGSTDGTGEYLRNSVAGLIDAHVIIHEQNQGIAAAIQTGIRAAANETVVSIDSDGSYDMQLLDTMIPLLDAHTDMVTASPYHPRGGVENVPGWRIWFSKRASQLYRFVMKQKLHCYTSCCRVYRRSQVADLELENQGYVGVAELAWRLDKKGATIVECPAVLRKRVAGASKMKVARATVEHLRFIRKAMIQPKRLNPQITRTINETSRTGSQPVS